MHRTQAAVRGPASPVFTAARRRLWKQAIEHGTFVVLPVLATAFFIQVAVRLHEFAVDFDHGPWIAGRHLLSGLGPYVGPHSPQIAAGSPFVYPALAAVLSVPFALIPHSAAGAIFTALNMIALALTLRVLQVRDWRLYGLVFLWPAVISGWQTANLTLMLGLGLAAAWRYRERPFVSGALVALLVSLKPFVWPVALWLLATRRYRALGWAAVCGLALNLAAWGIVGFDQIARYARLMSALTRILGKHAYSLLALSRLDHSAALYVLALALVALALTTCIVLGRRGRDRQAFALSVLACLLASPIVWLHYFALLIVPLAIARPRVGVIWFVPLIMFFSPSSPAQWQVLAALLVAAGLTAVSLREPSDAGKRIVHPPSKPASGALPLPHGSGPALPGRLKVTA